MPTYQQAVTWTANDVAKYLVEEGVDDEVVILFLEKGITGEKLLENNHEAQLVGLGVKSASARRTILNFVDDMNKRGAKLSANIGLPQFGVCSEHDMPFDYLCNKCEQMVCLKCEFDKHQGHGKSILSNEKLESLRTDLETSYEKIGDHLSSVQKAIDDCTQRLHDFPRSTESNIETILKVKTKLMAEIERLSEEAISRAKEDDAKLTSELRKRNEKNHELKSKLETLGEKFKNEFTGAASNNFNLVLEYRKNYQSVAKDVTALSSPSECILITYKDDIENVDLSKIMRKILVPSEVVKEKAAENSSGSKDYASKHSSRYTYQLPPENETSHLVAAGGNHSSKFFSSVDQYDIASKTWVTLPKMHTKRSHYFALGFSRNRLYVAGGYDGYSCLKSTEMLDLAAKKWITLPSMHVARKNTSGVFLEDGVSFLVTGGSEGKNRLASCEKLHTPSNQWLPIAPLSSPRSSHCTVLFQGKAVVLGGFNGHNDLNLCEEYSPLTDTWTPLPPFSRSRSAFGAAAIGPHIYIVGGSFDSIEVFDGIHWNMVNAKLARPRSDCAAVCLNGKLVVLGGEEDSIETFDPATSTVDQGSISMMPTRTRLFLGAVSY